LYTSEQWGKAATSEDFQTSFQVIGPGDRSSGKKGAGAARKSNAAKALDNLFDLWVYGIPSGTKK
jgi:hypothetical protein